MPDGIPDYDELKLRIEAAREGGYHVVASSSDGGTATGDFQSPISELELDNFILRVTRTRTRAYRSSQMEEAKKLGSALFEELLAEDVGDLYHGAYRVANSQGRGLRISLSMTEAPALLEIPWELLYDPSEARFLSQSIYTPVVRSLDLKNPPGPRKVTLPLRVLALASAPDGFPPLDVEAERRKLADALAPLVNSGALLLEWLDSATPSELESRIGHPDELHVIHYIGHGAYDDTHRGRHPRAGGLHRGPQRGHGRGARRIPVRQEEPPIGRAEFLRGSTGLARRPVLRRGLGPAARRDPGGHRDAGRDHRRGGDHFLRPALYGARAGVPGRRGAGSVETRHRRRGQGRGVRHAGALHKRGGRPDLRHHRAGPASAGWALGGGSRSGTRPHPGRRHGHLAAEDAQRGRLVAVGRHGPRQGRRDARWAAHARGGRHGGMHVDSGGRERLRGVRDRGRQGVGRAARERAGERASGG